MKDTPFSYVLTAATFAGLAAVYTMQWLGYGLLAVGIVGFGIAIAVYVIGGMIFMRD